MWVETFSKLKNKWICVKYGRKALNELCLICMLYFSTRKNDGLCLWNSLSTGPNRIIKNCKIIHKFNKYHAISFSFLFRYSSRNYCTKKDNTGKKNMRLVSSIPIDKTSMNSIDSSRSRFDFEITFIWVNLI